MKNLFENKKILIGITGSIAAYKTCSLINLLKKNENTVKVIMTKSATSFVAPQTFEALTGNQVFTKVFDENNSMNHIVLANWCDLLLISPATANTINKIANGIADDILSLIAMALQDEKPIVVAPAMNVNMWENRIMQDHVKYLKRIKRKNDKPKFYFIEPREGELACGVIGKGALARTEDIIERLIRCF